MGKKKNKNKGGNSTKQPALVDDDFPEVIDNDDDGSLTKEDCLVFAKMIMSTGKQLQKIANDFLEAFKNRCMLTIGSKMILFHEVMGNCDLDQEKRFVLPRIVIIYLIYRSRDLEPWIRRPKEGKKENIQGHPFLEFFISLAKYDGDPTDLPATEIPVHIVEQKMAKLILSRRAHELQMLTPSELFDKFEKSHFNAPDEKSYADLLAQFRQQTQLWPKSLDILTIPAITFHPTLVIKPEKELPFDMNTDEMEYIAYQLWCLEMPRMPFGGVTRPALNIPTGHESWERHFRGIEASTAPVEESEKQNASDADVDEKPTSVVELVHVELDREQPSTSTSAIPTPNMDDVVTKILRGDSLTNHECQEMALYLRNAPLKDARIGKMTEINPVLLRLMLDTNPRFLQPLFTKLVAYNNDLLHDYLEEFMDLGINTVALEVVIKAYRSIKDLEKDPLIQYLISIWKKLDSKNDGQEPQAVNYRVRTLCMFIQTLLTEKILNLDEMTSEAANDQLAEINQLLVKYSAQKPASTLFKHLADARRRRAQ